MRKISRVAHYGGIVAIVLALSKVHARFVAPVPYSWHSSSRFAWSIAYTAVLVIASYGMGLPDHVRTRRSALFSAIGASGVAAATMSLVQLATGDALLPRFVVFGAAVALVPWSLLCAALARRGRRLGEDRDRVLFIGADGAAATLAEDLDRGASERPAMFADHLDVEQSQPVSVASRPIGDAVAAAQATVLVLDHGAQDSEVVIAQVAALHETGLRVRTLSGFYEEWLGKLPVSDLERVSLLFDIGEIHRVRYARLKRLIDVTGAVVGLFALVVALPLVLLGDLVANRGPVFYRQERVGLRGRRFQILKFRSMRPTETNGTDWTAADDPRVTPFGAILRRTHLDELPQVWNILRGELSIVGPRPEQPRYVEELSEKLPFYDLRHLVHPGLTGWAQVNYGYAGDESDALEKLQYEFFYLRRQNLWLDLRTIVRTIRSVMGRAGR